MSKSCSPWYSSLGTQRLNSSSGHAPLFGYFFNRYIPFNHLSFIFHLHFLNGYQYFPECIQKYDYNRIPNNEICQQKNKPTAIQLFKSDKLWDILYQATLFIHIILIRWTLSYLLTPLNPRRLQENTRFSRIILSYNRFGRIALLLPRLHHRGFCKMQYTP